MIRPTHERPTQLASELFTDREDARERFERALDTPQRADEYRILVWYGVGGQGKSALQDEFGRILDRRAKIAKERKARPLGYAMLDFKSDENRSIAPALLSIRLQLGTTARLRFPAFDTAYFHTFPVSSRARISRQLIRNCSIRARKF